MSLYKLIGRYRRDNSGLAAMEFAIVLPIIFLLLIGTAAGLDIYQRHRAVAHSALTMADLGSRYDVINETEMEALLAVSQALAPSAPAFKRSFNNSDSGTKARIANIVNIGGSLTVSWSRNSNWEDLTDADLAELELPKLGEYNSIILTQVEAKYEPAFGDAIFDGFDMGYTAYRRPYLVDFVNVE